jgi:tetratricopeptide (TPR) repeat protein
MKVLMALFAALAVACVTNVRADGPDAQYIRIYNAIREADNLLQNGQSRAAYDKLVEAQSGLNNLHKAYPDWSERLVQFRLNYVNDKIDQLRPAMPAPAVAAAISTNTAPAAAVAVTQPTLVENPVVSVSGGLENKVQALTDENRRLASEKELLEAKLREALSAQPAAVAPQELARAEARIRAMEQERELLQTTIKQDQARMAKMSDPAALTETKKLLADANHKIEEQNKTIGVLREEKQILDSKLQAEPKATRSSTRKLKSENEALKKQLAAMKKETPATSGEIAALKNENASLKQQVVQLKTELASRAPAAAASAPATSEEFKKLQFENESLRKDIAILKTRASSPPTIKGAPEVTVAEPSQDSVQQIIKLQQERDELKRKLDAATNGNKKTPKKAEQLQKDLDALQARIETYEAKKTPYTAEELALFKAPAPVAAASRPVEVPTTNTNTANTTNTANATPAKRSMNDLPAGAGTLVAEARRDFSAGRYDEAERKYTQVLKLDEKNAFTLGNLAAIQLERGRFDDAEKNLKVALAAAPDDAYNLSLLGILKFRQDKFDEALDALSRSAKLDPNNAETQNYLGITFSQKGQREAAEAALRKSIQISPDYASAHHNLAIVYATQTPPFTALAKYHYQKAVILGHPKNPELEKLFNSGK